MHHRIFVLAALAAIAGLPDITYASPASGNPSHAKRSKEIVLYKFTGGNDGEYPQAGLILDSAGTLYGTALGGINNGGVVFSLSPAGRFKVLYSFCAEANCSDGSEPDASLIGDGLGNLYGTTCFGGKADQGTVFELTPKGKETVLYAFEGNNDGFCPSAGVIMDKRGNIYGTTSEGGGAGRYGTVFKLNPRGKETILHAFCSEKNCADGDNSASGLIMDGRGNLYGTTSFGGDVNCDEYHGGCGVVYEVTPSGDETVLYAFQGGTDSNNPFDGLAMDESGNLYGTAAHGGTFNNGTVFEVSNGTEQPLLSFPGGKLGALPTGTILRDQSGHFFGTTLEGGGNNSGVVFELKPDGRERVMKAFNGNDGGRESWSGVIADANGNLYGTTQAGGAYCQNNGGCGTIFEITP